MKFYRRVLKKPAVQRLISWLIAKYMKFVYWTSQWEKVDFDKAWRYAEQEKPVIIAFWHNRLMMPCFAWPLDEPFYMFISAHRDGKIISDAVKEFNIEMIQGSTARGGFKALRQALKLLDGGKMIGITPDGPRGPRFKVSKGTMNLAKLSGFDIVPFTYSVSRRKIFGSWDRFVLALPFSKGVFLCGDPIVMPKDPSDETLEKYRLILEKRLQTISDEADRICDVNPIR